MWFAAAADEFPVSRTSVASVVRAAIFATGLGARGRIRQARGAILNAGDGWVVQESAGKGQLIFGIQPDGQGLSPRQGSGKRGTQGECRLV